jgi:hypothetical protein
VVVLEIEAPDRKPSTLEQLAYDLCELTGLRLPYSHTSWRRGVLGFGGLRAVRVHRHVDIDFTELRAQASKAWVGRGDYMTSLQILERYLGS